MEGSDFKMNKCINCEDECFIYTCCAKCNVAWCDKCWWGKVLYPVQKYQKVLTLDICDDCYDKEPFEVKGYISVKIDAAHLIK
jgi:hypothetical protein